MENRAVSFAEEVAAIKASAGVSITDAICRVAKLSRAFSVEADLIRQRLERLETADEPSGRRVTRRRLRCFWCVVFVASAGSFAAGYLVGAR